MTLPRCFCVDVCVCVHVRGGCRTACVLRLRTIGAWKVLFPFSLWCCFLWGCQPTCRHTIVLFWFNKGCPLVFRWHRKSHSSKLDGIRNFAALVGASPWGFPGCSAPVTLLHIASPSVVRLGSSDMIWLPGSAQDSIEGIRSYMIISCRFMQSISFIRKALKRQHERKPWLHATLASRMLGLSERPAGAPTGDTLVPGSAVKITGGNYKAQKHPKATLRCVWLWVMWETLTNYGTAACLCMFMHVYAIITAISFARKYRCKRYTDHAVCEHIHRPFASFCINTLCHS